jgi:hypothetical protein
MMVARKKYTFWINPEQAEGLKRVKERDGVLESEQIRRAIDDWLGKKRLEKAARPRALTRGRA